MIINPFDNPIIRAPNQFPRSSYLYVANTQASYLQSNTNPYFAALYRPDMSICSHVSSNVPAYTQDYSAYNTVTGGNKLESDSRIPITSFTTNIIEYRLIAAAIRMRLSGSADGNGATLCGNFTVNNNNYDLNVPIGSIYTASMCIAPLVTTVSDVSLGANATAVRYDKQILSNAIHGEWEQHSGYRLTITDITHIGIAWA